MIFPRLIWLISPWIALLILSYASQHSLPASAAIPSPSSPSPKTTTTLSTLERRRSSSSAPECIQVRHLLCFIYSCQILAYLKGTLWIHLECGSGCIIYNYNRFPKICFFIFWVMPLHKSFFTFFKAKQMPLGPCWERWDSWLVPLTPALLSSGGNTSSRSFQCSMWMGLSMDGTWYRHNSSLSSRMPAPYTWNTDYRNLALIHGRNI